jgi:hypothetical protein
LLRHCIGITKKPPKNQNWYCHKCGAQTATNQRTSTLTSPNNSSGPIGLQLTPAAATVSAASVGAVGNNTDTAENVSQPGGLAENLMNKLSSNNGSNSSSNFLNSLSSMSNAPGSDYLSSLKKKAKKTPN